MDAMVNCQPLDCPVNRLNHGKRPFKTFDPDTKSYWSISPDPAQLAVIIGNEHG